MTSDDKLLAGLLAGAAVFAIIFFVTVTSIGNHKEKLKMEHEYRMAKIKCSEPTNSNKEVGE